MFEDGQLGEIFLTASGGGTYDALLSNWAIAVSIALQYGVPLQDFIKQFRYKEFQPNGFTGNREIPSALSPIDYVVQYLSLHCSGADAAPDKDTEHADTNRQGPPCTNCGHMMVRKGTCYYCEMCGDSSGCS
jgi:ribonucleoside-diphosphate reductase alpha chain